MSKRQKTVFTTLMFCFLFIHVAFGATYKNLVTFGDSLTDSGNIKTIAPDRYHTDYYSGGAFSNGKIWAEYFAEKLGINNKYLLANFLISGTWSPPDGNVWYNNAFGGAETGSKMEPLGLLSQVGVWANAGVNIPDNSLCIIWIGGNNFLNWIDDHSLNMGDYAEVTDNAVADIITALTTLTNVLGATDILIMNLPNLGKTPANNGYYGNNNTEYGTIVSSAFNNKLETAFTAFQATHPSVNYFLVDTYEFMEKAVENPQQFGFNNAVNQAMFDTRPEYGFNNVEKYLFWDTVHPTTEAHKDIANQIYGRILFENVNDEVIFFESHANDTLGLEYNELQDFRYVALSPNDYTAPNNTNKPDFIYGLFDITITLENNQTDAEFTVYFPEAAPTDAKWYKSTSDGWIDFDKSVIDDLNNDGAVFSEDRKQVTIHITDNGPYDDDDTIGIIKDPSGLGSEASSTDSDSGSSSGCFISTVLN